MADVYLAKLTGKSDFEKLAVVKRLKTSEEDDQDILDMFASEAHLCARLNHPNIVQTFEVGEDTNGPFLVMEFIEGQPVGRIRSRANRRGVVIPRPIVLKVIRDTLSALAYAHSLADHDGSDLAVVHRDVSPENVMITYAGLTKLVDFGVAKTAASMTHTRAGVIKGKVAYMAPEQARSDVNIDGRADIFAAGLLLWELVTGKRMWDGSGETEVIQRLLDDVPLPRARSMDPGVPAELDEVCAIALAKDPNDRYATANDFLDALEGVCNMHDLHASPREIGQFVGALFESEREKVKALVSGSVTRRRADSMTGEGSPVPPFEDAGSIRPRRPSGSEESEPLTWRSLSAGSKSSPSRADLSSSSSPSRSSRAETDVGVSETLHALPPQPRPALSKVVGVAVVLGLAFGSVALGARYLAQKPAAEPPVAIATAEPPPPPAPTEITVDLTVRPENARIFVDGAPAGGTPFHHRALARTGNREIRIEAEGYESRSILLAFDRDHTLDLSLTKSAPVVAPPPVTITRIVSVPAPSPARSTSPPRTNPTATTAGSLSGTEPAATNRGISEIDPAKPKTTPKHDKIDTDIFKR